jgi:hypothetical protein
MECNKSYVFKWSGILALQLVSYAIFSQDIVNDPIVDRFRSYTVKAVQEKLFLHTDKDFYIAGEVIWFKVYYADGTSHQPMEISKLAYVEVLNDKNEPIAQAKISLLPDEKAGSFYLPTSLPTGYYSIRAYTNWMKNFDASGFFERRITVVNTLKNPESTGRSSADSNDYIIDFFPEGGNLVSGIQSKVGFRALNRSGSIREYKGYIIGNNNDTVASFSPFRFGIGHFSFRPMQDNGYRAVVALPDGSVFNGKLPEVHDQGYTMGLEEQPGDLLLITVHKKSIGAQNVEPLLLLGHTRQQPVIAQKGFIGNDSLVFTIDKKKTGKGVTHFTLFNSAGKPLCERLFFTRPAKETLLAIGSDQISYAKREKISLRVNAQSTTTDLSVSVFYLDSLQRENKSTIVDYMWLSSDLSGNIESPAWYFSNDPDVDVAADNLMLTHGWRRFNWDNVMTGNQSFIKYLPEINGHLVTGIIKDPRYNKPVPRVEAYLSVPSYPFGFYSSESDANGFLQFDVKNYYGNGRIIAQPGLETDTFYRVDILKPFVEPPAGRKYPAFEPASHTKDQLLRRSIGMQSLNIYLGDSLRNFSDPFIQDTLPFYGKAEVTYKLDDYKRFTTMEEVLREYVREVGVGARNESLIFKIFNPEAHDFYDSHSLVLLDGVALANPDRIFRYDPLKVRKLDVIRSRYVLGHSMFNGIASFSSYEGTFDGYDLNPNLVAIDYAGLQLQRNFYSPAYETKEQLERRIPDFRTTLFWTPAVVTDKTGSASIEFYSSDLTGKYMIVVQGMDKEGNFIAESKVIEIK